MHNRLNDNAESAYSELVTGFVTEKLNRLCHRPTIYA